MLCKSFFFFSVVVPLPSWPALAMPCRALPCRALPWPSWLGMPYPALPCPGLAWFALPRAALPCPALPCLAPCCAAMRHTEQSSSPATALEVSKGSATYASLRSVIQSTAIEQPKPLPSCLVPIACCVLAISQQAGRNIKSCRDTHA